MPTEYPVHSPPVALRLRRVLWLDSALLGGVRMVTSQEAAMIVVKRRWSRMNEDKRWT